jgi:hypothetical protein
MAIAALYAGLGVGIVGMLYVGLYRNAAWLALLGVAGGCTAYGRWLGQRGQALAATRWKRVSGVVYGVFFAWVGTVLLQMLLG